MKANELMIGDWVYHKGKHHKVTSIMDGYVSTDEHSDSHDYHFEPVPLTEEILKMNGFDDVNLSNLHKCYFRQKDNEDGTELYNIEADFYSDTIDACFVDITCDSIGSVRLKCKYVHELQHALRLCGLTELADNFKIN